MIKITTIIHEINQLIENLNAESSQSEIEYILRTIPKEDIMVKKQIFNRIKNKTPLTNKDLEEIYNITHLPTEETVETKSKKQSIIELQNKLQKDNTEHDYLKYDNKLIEITNKEIYLLTPNKNKPNKYYREIMTAFALKILSKTKDYKKDNVMLYTFKANNDMFDNFEVKEFLKIFADKIFKKTIGQDVVKFIFYKKEKDVPEKKAKYILGYKNGWYLPINGDNDYSIIWYTDEQHLVLKNCKKMYKSHTEEELEKIKEKLKRFVEITQMPKEYLTILISFCIISPFKTYFIKKYALFPHLILSGKQFAGKTTILKFWSTDFFGHYKEHCSAQTAKSLARFEDIITASTLPRMIDEFNDVPNVIINLLKESATSISDYKRKLSATTQINRPKTTPLAITSNQLGEFFKDPANSSRAIVLEFENPIKRDPEWVKLQEELKKEKLFSLLYNYTKNWKDKDLDGLMEKVNKTINIDEIIAKIEKEDNGMLNIEANYPRIREIYQMIIAGAILFRDITGFKLQINNTLETLLSSRRNVSQELVSQFIEFCNNALAYDFEYHPKYLTQSLTYNNTDGYNFTQGNLRDFNEFLRKDYNLKNLAEMLIEGLTDKTKIQYVNRRIDGVKTRFILIGLGLLRDELAFGTEISENIY